MKNRKAQFFRLWRKVMQTTNIARRPPFRFTRIVPNDTAAVGHQSQIANQPDSYPVGRAGDHVSALKDATVKLSELLNVTLGAHGDLNGLTITDCESSDIVVDIPLGALYMYNLKDCVVTAVAVKGAIQIYDCSHLTINAFCSQMRITDSSHLRVFVQTNSSTAIVNSVGVMVGPPPRVLPGDAFENALATTGLLSRDYVLSDKWRNVADFNRLSHDSRNWEFIDSP